MPHPISVLFLILLFKILLFELSKGVMGVNEDFNIFVNDKFDSVESYAMAYGSVPVCAFFRLIS